jgi:hypothetical protein
MQYKGIKFQLLALAAPCWQKRWRFFWIEPRSSVYLLSTVYWMTNKLHPAAILFLRSAKCYSNNTVDSQWLALPSQICITARFEIMLNKNCWSMNFKLENIKCIITVTKISSHNGNLTHRSWQALRYQNSIFILTSSYRWNMNIFVSNET